MREIKFRVWYPYEWDGETDKPIKFKMSYDWAFEEYAPINDLLNSFDDDHKIMQYTGLKDKNSKEIYEGDVLQKYITDYEHEDYQEFVDSGYETIEPMKKITDVCSLEHFRYWLKNESFGYEGEYLESPEDWEIIGNIYENPELI